MALARKLAEASAADLWRALRRRVGRGTAPDAPARCYQPVTGAFLRSEEYRRLMALHLPHPGVYDRHEAQNETRSYRYRHGEASARLGVFRWRGLQEHLDEVLALLEAPGSTVIDFGGAACPVGFGAQVVDRLACDGTGRAVPFRELADVPDGIDGVFTSHALEHVPELDEVIALFHRKLRPGGRLLAHLPAWSCVRWRAGVHRHALYNDHVWTFGLPEDAKPDGLMHYRDVAELFGALFEDVRAGYCGDDSLFVSAKR